MRFSDIIGQDTIKKKLINSVLENRVSHAQLFLGPDGCGKLALAIAYAQYISCENKQADDSCGVCRSCVKYEKLAHPDLHFIYPVSGSKDTSKTYLKEWRSFLTEKKYYVGLNDWFKYLEFENKQGIINASDCNEIIKTLSLRAYESEYKIVIIWMVEKLFHSAAPKLLKILEEPPDKTLFILLSENPDLILPTILSRTQLLKIPPISDKSLIEALVSKQSLPPKRAHEIVRLSAGNYTTALSLLNTDEDSFFNAFREWMLLCYGNKFADIVKWIEDLAKTGREKQKQFLRYGLEIVRSCTLYNFSQHQLILNEQEEETAFIAKIAKFIHPGNAVLFSDEFERAVYHIERNANPKILMLDLSIKAAEFLKRAPGN